MNKKGKISPSFKYGTVYAEKIFGMLFLMVAIYALVYGAEGGFGNTNSTTLLFYFGVISLIMIFVIQLMNNASYIPVSISFGSRRKDAFFGTQWINFIMFIQSIVIFGGYLLFLSDDLDGMKLLVIFIYSILIISLGGFGQFVGAISIKYGKLGAFLFAAIIFVLIVSSIIAIAFNGIFETNTVLTDSSFTVKILVLLLSCMIYVGSSYFNYQILQKYEVRG